MDTITQSRQSINSTPRRSKCELSNLDRQSLPIGLYPLRRSPTSANTRETIPQTFGSLARKKHAEWTKDGLAIDPYSETLCPPVRK